MPKKLTLAKGVAARAKWDSTTTVVGTHVRPWSPGAEVTISARVHYAPWAEPDKQARIRVYDDGVLVLRDPAVLGGGEPALPPAEYRNPTLRAKQLARTTGCHAAHDPATDEQAVYVPIITKRDRNAAAKMAAAQAIVDAGDRRPPQSIVAAMVVVGRDLTLPPAPHNPKTQWVEV